MAIPGEPSGDSLLDSARVEHDEFEPGPEFWDDRRAGPSVGCRVVGALQTNSPWGGDGPWTGEMSPGETLESRSVF